MSGDGITRTARLSPCGRYRYHLGRRWGDGPAATFIMLNPSTADAEVDDPTIRRCVGFARAWHLDAVNVVNLYALRATDPRVMLADPDPVGPDNDAWLSLTATARLGDGGPLVAAWGAHARPDRVAALLQLLRTLDRLQCLGTTKAGQPRHPLYLRADSVLTAWPPHTWQVQA